MFEEEGGAYPEVARAIESEIQGYRVDDTYLWEVADDVDPEAPRFVYGAILGVVDLVDVHTADDIEQIVHLRGEWPVCSPWAERRGHHLVLANPRALAKPLPYRGALGLRRLDDGTTAQIFAQIGEPA